ncbi:hypothetical protein GXP67_24685 [Rhodocytophaga rosea]|uniref:DUF4386 domain-containing protein n=1 Tax=Rhodocytophaga rosea TaxID=2704465 RepID=A0A6C0GNK3_9BACT|nr:hypothetical protein [Rhodocytophaga rosea]QHT69615.1 hypothetical protein GXP67_24685 [Rhodocytophaga rosea]
MTTSASFEKQVGIISIVSGILCLACLLLGMIVVEFNIDLFSSPTQLLAVSHQYAYAKWFCILDMFGYYLMLLPAIFYLHQLLKKQTQWHMLLTFCGLSYVLVGAIGAAILAVVWPHLMKEYLAASSSEQEMISVAFKSITVLVNDGLWNMLEVVVAGVWWVGTGLVLYPAFRHFGFISILTGICCLLDGLGNILEWKLLAEIGLNGYLFLAIIWPMWLGKLLLKGKFNQFRNSKAIVV